MAMDMSDRILQPISTAELQRRWSETRKAMEKEGIDCLVVQNSNQFLGGYVRWFIDVPTETGYPTTVIFPAKDEMTVVTHGAKTAPGGPPDFVPASFGIKRRIGIPYFRSVCYNDPMDGEAIVEDLRARNVKKVGMVNKGNMFASTYEHTVNHLEGIEFVDATDMVDQIKCIKSAEEIDLIKKAAKLQDETWEEILNFIKPGKREYEIRAQLKRICTEKGSEEQWLMLGSAPAGQPANLKPTFFQNRLLQPGDYVTVLIEVNGPGGFYCELSRVACLGTIPDELAKTWEGAVEAQKFTAARLVPGAKPAEIFKAHNDFMVSRGLPPEARLYAHGQGYDLVERPLIREDEPMAIAANMNITVHPMPVTDKVMVDCNDNYIVGEHGVERIHTTPWEIFVV